MQLTGKALKEHHKNVEAFIGRLRAFLSTPNHSDTDWPVIAGEELGASAELVREIFELKWARDCDGDLPIRFSMLDRRRHRLVWDCPVSVDPRHAESLDEGERRLLSNLRTLTGAVGSYAHELKIVEQELDAIQRTRATRAAAIGVVQVDYVTPEGYAPKLDRPISLHRTLAEAEAFNPAGYARKRMVPVWAVPDLHADSTDHYADFRAKVAAACGKVVPRRETHNALGIRTTEPPKV